MVRKKETLRSEGFTLGSPYWPPHVKQFSICAPAAAVGSTFARRTFIVSPAPASRPISPTRPRTSASLSGSLTAGMRAARCPSVAQVCLALIQPSMLIRHSQRIQVLRRPSRGVHLFSQQRSAVNDIDSEFATLVFVREIAPQRIIRI